MRPSTFHLHADRAEGSTRSHSAALALRDVLARAGQYVASYHEELSMLVGVETYTQSSARDVEYARDRPPAEADERHRERKLVSEFVLMAASGRGSPWIAFRDVVEVDGQTVRPADERLPRVLRAGGDALERARAIAFESARFNIGEVYRTVNVPTLALQFLLAENQPRFRFTHGGMKALDARTLWEIRFTEKQRPTIIRDLSGRSVPASGAFWIDPETGAVLESELATNAAKGVRARISVTYVRDHRLGLLVPAQMRELYDTPTSRLEGVATYANFRRFETDARVIR